MPKAFGSARIVDYLKKMGPFSGQVDVSDEVFDHGCDSHRNEVAHGHRDVLGLEGCEMAKHVRICNQFFGEGQDD